MPRTADAYFREVVKNTGADARASRASGTYL